MERIKLTQWRVRVNGKDEAMFTPFHMGKKASEERETAMAIAAATFDGEITELEDEGLFHQPITSAQLHVADPKFCASCEGYNSHDRICPHAQDDAMDAAELAGDIRRDDAGGR